MVEAMDLYKVLMIARRLAFTTAIAMVLKSMAQIHHERKGVLPGWCTVRRGLGRRKAAGRFHPEIAVP
jgi:hypothetical protein